MAVGLPAALMSKYKQYKDDTKIIIEWLAESALQCGYNPTDEASTGDKPTAKLKGRARKLARDAATATKDKPPVIQNGPRIVKVRELEPMAWAIVKSEDKKVIVPLRILKTFRDCINARGNVGKWYEAAQDKAVVEDNSHNYFIEALKRTLQILLPVQELQQLTKNDFKLPKKSTTESNTHATNPYHHLQIQDIDEAAYEALEDATAPKTVTYETGAWKKKAKYQPENLDAFNEWHFAFALFCDDIKRLESAVEETWVAYEGGEVDLTTAAIVTNTAVEMIRKAEEEFEKEAKPEPYQASKSRRGRGRDMHLTELWFMECCLRDGILPDEAHSYPTDPQYMVQLDLWPQVKESYTFLRIMVHVYSNGVKPGLRGPDRIFATSRPAYLGSYNPELDFEDLKPRRQCEQMAALLNDMLVTLGALAMLSDSPADDALLDGLNYLQQNQVDPPMWLLFACQNFLNMHFVLQTKSERGFEELGTFAIAAKRNLKEHFNFMAEHSLGQLRDGEDEAAVLELMDEIDLWVLKDNVKQLMTSQQVEGLTTRKRRIWQDYEVLRMSPILCGTWKYVWQIQLQWKGITLMNDSQLLSAAHLYNALLQNHHLDRDGQLVLWDDMEYLLDLHRAEDTFMGKRPTTIENCTKRFAMIQGVSPSTFVRRRRGDNRRVLRSRAGSKFLSPSTAVAQIFGQKYMSRRNDEWHLEQLDTIVQSVFADEKKRDDAMNKSLDERIANIDITTPQGCRDLLEAFDFPSLKNKTPRLVNIFTQADMNEDEARETALRKLASTTLKESLISAKWQDPTRAALEDMESRKPIVSLIAALPKRKPKGDDLGGVLAHAILCSMYEVMPWATEKPKSWSPFDDLTGDSEDEDEHEQPEEEEEENFDLTLENGLAEIIDRWERTKTLPLDIFIDILSDSLEKECLDIQFDYFSFFRSCMTLLLKIQEKLLPILHPMSTDDGQYPVYSMMPTTVGAIMIIPQMTLLIACDLMNSPNLFALKASLEVDDGPLRLAGEVMREWLEEHGDDYCYAEETREGKRVQHVRKEGRRVQYLDEEDEPLEGILKNEDRKIGWSSAVGVIDGLNARETRRVFDEQRKDGPLGRNVAEVMAMLQGIEMDDRDREGVRIRDEIKAMARPNSKAQEGESSDEDVD